MMNTLRALLLVLTGILGTSSFAASPSARVESFSPAGSAKAIGSVSVRFATPMVAFGEPRLADPFTMDCALPGSGRWLDARNWVFDIAGTPPVGLRCQFALRAGLRDSQGQAVGGQQRFAFDTGGPSILQSEPWEGSTIDENQVFLLGLDAPVDTATLEQRVHCGAEGVGEQIGVRVLKHDERRAVLAASPWFLRRYAMARLPATYEQTLVARTAADEAAVRERYAALTDGPDSALVAVQCRQRLPAAAKVFLDFGPGIAAASGISNAERQTLAYETRADFTATQSCQRARRDGGCLPGFDIRLDFNAAVPREALLAATLEGPDGQRFPVTVDGSTGDLWSNGLVARGPFPPHAKLRLTLPAGLSDDAGRTLANAASFPLIIRTEEDPPLAKFAAEFGIVEAHGEPALPISVRNIEPNLIVSARPASTPTTPGITGFIDEQIDQLLRRDHGFTGAPTVRAGIKGRLLRVPVDDVAAIGRWFQQVKQARRYDWFWNEEKQASELRGQPGMTEVLREASGVTAFEVPRQTPAKALEMVGIPLPKPGFYVAEIASPRLGAALFAKPAPYYVQAMALVTNLGVHLKWGRESSLVWVTALDSGKPVAKAAVSVHDCAGKTLWQGTTDRQGVATIAEALPNNQQLPDCGWNSRGLIAVARYGEDASFVASDWNNGISTWQFGLPGPNWFSAHSAVSVLDRSLFKPGETVHMKHLLRARSTRGFAAWQPESLQVRLRHDGSGTEIPLDATLDNDTGSALSDWTIPASARQGTYRIQIADGDAWLEAGEFRVEQFRVPLLRAALQPQDLPVVNRDRLPLDLQITYLAGGGASELPVKLRGLIQARTVGFTDYEDYVFANGDVSVGETDQTEAAWSAPSYQPAPPPQALPVQSLTLDKTGGARLELTALPKSTTPQTLVAEVEYPDPNGEVLTAATRVPLWPSAVLLGIKPRDWTMSRREVVFTTVALDTRGRPLAGVEVTVDLFQKINYSSRKRLLGGFYAWENRSEVKPLGQACRGRTDARGELVCTTSTEIAGNLILRAQTLDAAGNPSVVNRDVWVANDQDWWFAQGNDDRMSLVPERREYAPGETARLQVRMPFRAATALVSLEREGVLWQQVVDLSGKAPVVEVPIPPEGAPNVFVSVLAVRGRERAIQPTALVDLGRPAFKLGMTELRVGWAAHALKVSVTPERETYQPGQRAAVEIVVRRADGKALPPHSEVALAAVDEGLLELRPNASWQVLESMLTRRGIEVQTATAQMQVVGKRHYGRKAVAPGGGGGSGSGTRRMFDTLLLWAPKLALDAQGRARIEVPLNDSLTSFRLVAVATAGTGHFGTGSASIRSTQPLMLHAGLPAMVRVGDRYRASFTLRNASDKALSATLAAQVSVTQDAGETSASPLPAQQLSLAPGAAQEVSWDYEAPDASGLRWTVTADAGAAAQDALSVKQTVLPAIPLSTLQASLLHVQGEQTLPVAAPVGALPGGGLRISLQASLAQVPAGVETWFRQYPFRCLEQRVSKAVGLGDDTEWDALMSELPGYLDEHGLARYFPGQGAGSDVLSAYLLSLAADAGREIPALQRMPLREGLIGVLEGRYQPRSPLPTADLSLRKIAILAALARQPEGLNPGWLDSIDETPRLWPSSAVVDWLDILLRSPDLPGQPARLKATLDELRARLVPQGNQLMLASAPGDQLPSLMVSGDLTHNRLLGLVAALPDWASDAPRLLQGALARQQAGHWDTTAANAVGVLALRKFAENFEKTPVAGRTSLSLAGQQREQAWPTPAIAQTLPWPSAPAVLRLQHSGSGAPWASLESRAAVPLSAPVASGYRITRRVEAISRQTPEAWHRGDVYSVVLEIDARSEMPWVAVSDPLPAGAVALGSGLGGDSATLGQDDSGASLTPSFTERGADGYRAYLEYLPAGRSVLRYRVRLNNAGSFALPPTRVDAMYAPAVFGASPNEPLTVLP